MARRYHSPSSVKLGSRCQHAWALTYIDQRRPRELDWADIASGKVTPRGGERSRTLGKEVHGRVESHVGRALGRVDLAEPTWEDLPGRMAHEAIAYLPAFDHILGIEVPIGMPAGWPVSAPRPARGEAPTFALHGLQWAGLVDVLEIGASGLVTIRDWKTSSDPAKWGMTPAAVRDDWQACLYAAWACEHYQIDEATAAWTYLRSREPIKSHESIAVIPAAHARAVLEHPAEIARELDRLTTSAAAPRNTDACSDFGRPGQINCAHHTENGGTCDARIPAAQRYKNALTACANRVEVGRPDLIRLTRKGEPIMNAPAKPTGLAALAAQRAAQNQGATAPATTQAGPAEPVPGTSGEPAETLAPTPTPTPSPAPEQHASGRPLVAKPAAAKPRAKAGKIEGALSSALAPLLADLAAAEAAMLDAASALDAARDAIAQAVAR